MGRNCPVYFLRDLNAHHRAFDYGNNDNKGNLLIQCINRGILKHKGPDFDTLTNSKGRPDIILTNRRGYLNMTITEGDITTSDRIPIIVKISTKPIIKEIKKD